jgi:hypothetical protein
LQHHRGLGVRHVVFVCSEAPACLPLQAFHRAAPAHTHAAARQQYSMVTCSRQGWMSVLSSRVVKVLW